MLVLNLVLLALLASSTAQSGIARYSQDLFNPDENSQYEDTEDQLVAAEKERIWPESPPELIEVVTAEDQYLLTTPEPYIMNQQDSGEGAESSVWKVVLILGVLLVSIAGSLSVAYYMCVWRGGRFHYKPQKEDYA